MSLRHDVLRYSSPVELAHYFRHDLEDIDTASLSEQLIHSVTTGFIPPTGFWVWLSLDRKEIELAVRDALRQNASILVRRYATREFGRRLRTASWADFWNAMGGTKGLLDFFTTLSVDEVRALCKAIRMSAGSTKDRTARRSEVSGLLRALCSRHFPDSKFQNPDQRPLDKFYALILPACSRDMIEAWQNAENLPEVRTRICLQAQTSYRQICTERLFKDPEKNLELYQSLVRSVPDLPSKEKGFSESMRLASDLIKRVNSENFRVPSLVDLVIMPLFRRMKKRKTTQAAKLHVLQLAVEHLQKNKDFDVAKRLSLKSQGLVYFAIRFWSNDPDAFEQTLIDLLELIPRSSVAVPISLVERLTDVPVKHRYQLLKLLMKHVPGPGLDVDADKDLAVDTIWPASLFFSLPTPSARNLLTRIISSRGTESVLSYAWPNGSMFQSLGRLPDGLTGVEMMKVYLHRDLPDSHESARLLVERFKQQANTASDQAIRSQWVKATLQSSVASGSLDLLKDTIVWARRFNRDARTVKDVYSEQNIHGNEWRRLLGGIAVLATTPEQVKERICKTHEILLELLHTACMVLQEPDYHYWGSVRRLFTIVVQERITNADRLQKDLGIDDSSFFQTVWRPTIDVLIEAERIGNQPSNERLGLNGLEGVMTLGSYSFNFPIEVEEMPTYLFLDRLAEERDRFWQQHRAAQRPAVMTLPDVFPRGLPVQALQLIKVKKPHHDLPYIRKRAQNVVLISPAKLTNPLRFSDEETKAIGPFVDSYTTALRLYVDFPSKDTTRTDRITLAWRHAVLELSHDLMSTEEANLFWNKIFTEAGVEKDDILPVRVRVEIPNVDDPNVPTEWTPYPVHTKPTISSRQLRPSMLNLMLRVDNNTGPTISSPLKGIDEPLSTRAQVTDGWEVSPMTDEGLVISTLLYLNSRYGPGISLLKRPFPSGNNARFPALFLEDEFIERDLGDPLWMLSKRLDRIPPQLLASLVASMLKHLESKQNDPDQISYSMETLQLALRSDNPLPSLQYLRQVVVDLPGYSSWHRHLLNDGTLNRLPPDQVEALLEDIIASTIAKFHSRAKADDGKKDSSPNSQPLVKISTIKLLAQSLRKADFVRPQFTVDVLIKLLINAKHVDVKAATISSLTSLLGQAENSALQEPIFVALKHAIPIAASINERKQYTEAAWEELLSSNQVPDISSETPVLDTLTQATTDASLPGRIRNRIVLELLLPVFEKSILQHEYWHRCFLKANHPEQSGGLQWEVGCVRVELFRFLIEKHLSILPRRVLDIYYNLSMEMLDPESKLNKITAALFASSKRPLNNIQGHHWVDLYTLSKAQHLVVMERALKNRWDPVDSTNGITPSHMQNAIIGLLKQVIITWNGSLNYLITALEPPVRSTQKLRVAWERNCRPIVETLVDWLDKDIRTPKWKADPARRPSVLPDTFEMRLYLLKYPNTPDWEPKDTERRDAFSAEIISLLQEIAQTTPYHRRYNQIKEAARRVHEELYLYLAISLGSVTGDEPLPEQVMRVELAQELLEDRRVDRQQRPGDNVAQAAVRMIKELQQHPDEEIRNITSHIVKSLTRFSNDWLAVELKST